MKTSIRTIIVTFVSLILFSGVSSAQQKKDKKEAEVTFISDIDCPSCKKKLEAKLPYELGVKDLKIDLEKKSIWFKYDSAKTDKVKLAKAIEKLGYSAKEIGNGSNGEIKNQGNKTPDKGNGKTDTKNNSPQ
jgi:copper chaperone CopZ